MLYNNVSNRCLSIFLIWNIISKLFQLKPTKPTEANKNNMKLGIDIGSTTIKFAVLTEQNELLYKSYERHYSKITEKLLECLRDVKKKFPDISNLSVAITGSAGMGLAEDLNISFVQEVFATKVAADLLSPDTDVIIELGGEDAKILFLSSGLEVRMNGSCAGGTGAFIDQISTLLDISPDDMNDYAKQHQKLYPIASRCGVFAKSDIQPLLNQGAKKEDLCASIFYSVVGQTITGLAQGREIKGNVVYLGGPLTYMSELRKSFDNSLNLKGLCPKNSLNYVSIGCAICADTVIHIDDFIERLSNYRSEFRFNKTEPLFKDKAQYDAFKARHDKQTVEQNDDLTYSGDVFIGIDAGSTTIKVVVIDKNEHILFSEYKPNGGNPIPVIKHFLEKFYNDYPNVTIRSASVTGYGEDMIKNAFSLDFGLVETIAHYTAAKKFNKDVDFIIDIGGQDMKCFKISNGAIDDIFLNEACSSGCGSFLQSFASVLGYKPSSFAKLGLFANAPVDLGSRCTVFMNSSVKQAQKDGASVENISAGLSISVVKNAIYKVIRATKAEDLGQNIVVQGGTFLSNAVLRAFEKEIDGEVVRPNIAGIMGAYGAALYGKQRSKKASTILDLSSLKDFSHNVTHTHCKGCANNCALTINMFDGKRRYIAGNRCDIPTRTNQVRDQGLNLFEYKRVLLSRYFEKQIPNPKGKVGIPMVLNNYELLPFWSKFFETLGYEVVTTGFSNSETYLNGQHSIPSDTICFPAKLVHGHIEKLAKTNVDFIFYPCMSYNIDEKKGDNCYNCPVVAYYPETIANNVSAVKTLNFVYDYIGLHRPNDFTKKIYEILSNHIEGLDKRVVKLATKNAFCEHENFLLDIRKKAKEMIQQARDKGFQIIVVAGRPYHLDSKVNHGIDKLISTYNVAVITEDSISHLANGKTFVDVLNQWTYHARLYDAARYVAMQNDMQFVQLVSFGCGVDAVTTDEVRAILSRNKKIYTQLKIDEITNLGAAKIRIRSLLAAISKEG